MHMFHRKILIVGHPRTGTTYAAHLLRQLGLDIGHERDGKEGLSSWMFAVDSDESPYAFSPVARTRKALCWQYLIHPVRDITTAVPSIMREDIYAPPSYAFRRTHISSMFGIDLDIFESDFQRAVASLIYWSKLIQQMRPDVAFRIEDQSARLLGFARDRFETVITTIEKLDTSPVNVDKLYKGKRYEKPRVKPDAWLELSPDLQADVGAYCREYGYDLPAALGRSSEALQ